MYWGSFGYGEVRRDKNSIGYRFRICKIQNQFYIKIGMDWDKGDFNQYIFLEQSAFFRYIPVAIKAYSCAAEAEKDLKIIKTWLVKACLSRPKSKQFITSY